MILIDGRKAREYYLPILQEKIKARGELTLLIIQVGNRSDSNAYINAKKAFAIKIGVKVRHINFPETISQEEIVDLISKSNADKDINGIIVQLPLPAHINSDEVIDTIDSKKDVDGLTNNTKFMPATARGISLLLDFYKIEILNKNIVVMGRSKLVGTPIANMCRARRAVVTVLHSGSTNVTNHTKKADILIVAIGKANFVTDEHVSPGQIVIDVGITRIGDGDGVLVGDVDFEKVKNIVEMITPVPGGVGQMTVLSLFENLADAC